MVTFEAHACCSRRPRHALFASEPKPEPTPRRKTSIKLVSAPFQLVHIDIFDSRHECLLAYILSLVARGAVLPSTLHNEH